MPHPNSPMETTAVCPFYLRDINKPMAQIYCEGIYGRHVCTTFTRRADKEAHGRRYCTSENCAECMIYQANMQKYETKEAVHNAET